VFKAQGQIKTFEDQAGEHARSTGSNGQKSRGKELCRQRFLIRNACCWMLKRNRSGRLRSTFYTPQHSGGQGMSMFITNAFKYENGYHGTRRMLGHSAAVLTGSKSSFFCFE